MAADEEIDFSTLDWRRLTAAERVDLRPAFVRHAHSLRSECALAMITAVAGVSRRAVKAIGNAVCRLREVLAERAAVSKLHALDDAALRDIGIRRSEIESIVHGGDKDHTRVQRMPDGAKKSATRRCDRSLAA